MSRRAALLTLTALAACACPRPAATASADEQAPASAAPAPVTSSAVTVRRLVRYAAFAAATDERGAATNVLVTVVRADDVAVGDLSLRGTWAAAVGVVPANRTCPERYALFGDARAEPARREAMLVVLREHLSRSEHAWYRPTFEAPLLAELGAHGYVQLKESADGDTADVDVSSGSLPTAVTVRPPGGGAPWIDLRLPPPIEQLRGPPIPSLEATADLAHPVMPVLGLTVVDPISGRRLAARPGTYAFGAHWTPRDPALVR
ncbi:MAG: hypothetical protein KF878_08135 [Planctomycetes bacterium]|nr:hypothetical protein [Planctomycetota bacterium]